MEKIKSVARRWGSSLGVIIPRDVVEKEHIKEGQQIDFLILKDSRALRETFGTLKFKKTSQQMKDETRAELYD
jgi:antitoxin component of MazEF toxin-antitoxin module